MNCVSLRNFIIVAILLSVLGYMTYRTTQQSPLVWPDQDWIVFTCAPSADDGDIYRMLPDGSEITQLTNSSDDEAYPHWASKTGWIYFWNGYASGPNIRRMRFDGTHTEDFWSDTFPNGFNISPSGNFAVFSKHTRHAGIDIYLLKMKNGDPITFTPLTDSVADGGGNWSPVFSPDEEWIAYISTQDGNQEIYLMRGDGSEKTRLTKTDEDEWSLAWSPDGKWIIFSSGALTEANIFRVNILTHEIQPLVIWEGLQDWPIWSPDGEWIIFSSSEDPQSKPSQLYKMHLDGSDVQKLTNMSCSARQPQWISAHVVESATAEPTD